MPMDFLALPPLREVLADPQIEQRMVEAINSCLLTEEQRRWLAAHQLQIADLLHARFNPSLEPDVTGIFCRWNQQVGAPIFAIWP